MSKLVLDPLLRSELNGLSEQIEVCDESGRTCGFLVPEGIYKRLLKSVNIPFTDAEMEKFRNSGDGRPLSDLWKDLGVA